MTQPQNPTQLRKGKSVVKLSSKGKSAVSNFRYKTYGSVYNSRMFNASYENQTLKIVNERGSVHTYDLKSIMKYLEWLRDTAGWGVKNAPGTLGNEAFFPLDNQVDKMPSPKEGFGSCIKILTGNNTIAQGSSYLGPILAEAGILEFQVRPLAHPNAGNRQIHFRICVPLEMEFLDEYLSNELSEMNDAA